MKCDIYGGAEGEEDSKITLGDDKKVSGNNL